MSSGKKSHLYALRSIFVRALSLRGASHFDINDELARRLNTLGGMASVW